MPEPTIEEMLDFLNTIEASAKANQPRGFKQEFLDAAWAEGMQVLNAIRAILGQHRTCQAHIREKDNYIAQLEREGVEAEVEIIRAFVERVEKRLPDYNTGKGADSWLKAYRVAVMDELAEMEKGPGASHSPQDRPS